MAHKKLNPVNLPKMFSLVALLATCEHIVAQVLIMPCKKHTDKLLTVKLSFSKKNVF